MKTYAPHANAAPSEPASVRAPRAEAVLQELATARHALTQAAIDQSPRMLAQRRAIESITGVALRPAGAQQGNRNGPPGQLKASLESLSGMDMSAVRVHRNSDKPAQLNALAYAQGNEIHLGPQQEKHLPHEAWHVVQQKQGRVKKTVQLGGRGVNDEGRLETDADVMGNRAVLQGAGMKAAGTRKVPIPDVLRRQAVEPGCGRLPEQSQASAGAPVLQARLIVGGSSIPEEAIRTQGPQKKGIDKAISRRIKGLGMKPLPVRIALANLAASEGEHHFPTMRSAVEEAIVMARNNVSQDAVAQIEEGEDQAHLAMQQHEGTAGLPKAEIWRMVMDGKHQASRGKYGFENESGYMGAMLRGFSQMLGTVGTPLDAGMYEALHDSAVRGVRTRSGEQMDERYRDNPQMGEGFGLDMENWSPAGHAELHKKFQKKRTDPVGSMLAENPNKMIERSVDGQALAGKQVFRVRPTNSREHAVELAQEVISRYHDDIVAADELPEEAAQRDAKLTAIARICQDLDQMHLFTDGNIRTIVFLVLNKLLLEQGFSPVIMSEPNVFDCKSVDELKAEIGRGQRNYRRHARD
ncbi:DUF4157 domain-containing protein [Roseateles sp.]|uniref:eCIS core domain-containing protein n=1 Tax=Roseateles sp. TaxID=1971397 RepID=UPI0031D99215